MRRILPSLAVLGALLCGAASPPPGWTSPTIPGYGAIHVWPQATDRPDPAHTYKALFVLDSADSAGTGLNQALLQVARAVNEFGAAGVPLAHLRFRVVIKGGATPIVLNDATFQARFHKPNPNRDLIARLEKAGVTFLVCGNALFGFQANPAQLAPGIGVALSALSSEIIAADQGYAIIQ